MAFDMTQIKQTEQETILSEATSVSQEQEVIASEVTIASQGTGLVSLTNFFSSNPTIQVPKELARVFNITWKVPEDLQGLLQRSNFPRRLDSYSAIIKEAEQCYTGSSSEEEVAVSTELKKWQGIRGT